MRKIIFRLEAGFAGMDAAENAVFADDVTEVELDNEAWERAIEHASAYGVYPTEDKPDDWDEDEESDWRSDQYSDNIEGYWEDYDPEKHDGLVAGGGDWVWRE
jgi:hypothetical protein